MKTVTKRIILIAVSFFTGAAAVLLLITLVGGNNTIVIFSSGETLKKGSINANANNDELISAAYKIAEYIKNGDFESLGDIAHPTEGVTFSPYATIAAQSAQRFTPAQLRAAGRDRQVYVWGVYDGSSEPIELTVTDYFARFVFDRDYTRAKLIGIDRVVRSGNALENIAEVYPEMRYIELHIPATDAIDVDWGTLRIGFLEYEDSLMLALILHSEHTK